MRGGLFDENYVVAKDDFLQFCADWNRPASEEISTRVAELPARVDYMTLKDAIEAANEPVLTRLFLEYLPRALVGDTETRRDLESVFN